MLTKATALVALLTVCILTLSWRQQPGIVLHEAKRRPADSSGMSNAHRVPRCGTLHS